MNTKPVTYPQTDRWSSLVVAWHRAFGPFVYGLWQVSHSAGGLVCQHLYPALYVQPAPGLVGLSVFTLYSVIGDLLGWLAVAGWHRADWGSVLGWAQGMAFMR